MSFFIIKTAIFLYILCVKYSSADLNKDRLFLNINNPIPCVRRFNATHQIGCGKLDHTSYTGIVYAVRNQLEFDRLDFLNDLRKRKLILVVTPNMFSQVVEYYKKDSSVDKINGIVLVASKETLTNSTLDLYSDDSKNPNNLFSIYAALNQSNEPSAIDWNTGGTGFMFESFNIPFYVITTENEAKQPFNECYDKFNKKVFERADDKKTKFVVSANDLLCGMQLGLEMYGAVSSTVCTRRSTIIHTVETNSFCDPLGGTNYYTFLSQQPSNKLPIVMVTARLDTFTMYEYFTPAANEPISSIIGFLALVELFAKHRNEKQKSNVLFVLFDNEAFDYGGSSRFANDLLLSKFPQINVNDAFDGSNTFTLAKDNITTIIELNQLGSLGLEVNSNLYVHKDPVSYGLNVSISKIIDDLTKSLQSFSNNSIIPVENINQQLPSSSIHSFIRQGFQVGGISIADFDKKYKNPFYHSVFDTPESINVTYPSENITEADAINYTTKLASSLQKMLTSVAKTIYSTTNVGDLKDEINLKTLNTLVYCFYKNTSCSFFKSILTKDEWKYYTALLDSTLPKGRLSFYTSVYDNKVSGKWISFLLLRFFSRNLKIESFNQTQCKANSDELNQFLKDSKVSIKSLVYVNSSICIASAVYTVTSVSPAFAQVDDGVLVNTDKFSAWTESSWASTPIQMKLFMFTNDSLKIVTLFLGILSFLSSIAITFAINKYSSKWFGFIGQQETSTEFLE